MRRLARACTLTSFVALALACACAMGSGACSSASPTDVAPAILDAGSPAEDAGVSLDATVAPVDDGAAAFDANLPDPLSTLSQTGLFSNLSTKTIADNAMPFAPASPLWSDAADKHRWIVLPPGTKIDTSDMNHWRFPIGTRFFKEFAREGKRLETRMIAIRAATGDAEKDIWAGSFVWRDDESDADFAIAGKDDLRGTDHDAPSQTRCFACHVGEPGHILGFSALQLSKGASATDTTMTSLAAAGLLSNPPAPGTDTPFPGSGTPAGAAAAYLHANCGHCHNPTGAAWPDAQMMLRLDVGETDVTQSALAKTTVGVALTRWSKPGYAKRIAPGSPSTSGILFRMSARGNNDQMPPIATEHVDPAGIAALTTWISAL